MDEIESGVYVITNTINGKVYIGSTVDFRARWYNHRRELQNGIHYNSHLQHSWNKYGENAFKFSVLELLETEEDLVTAEQSWIDKYYEKGIETYNTRIAQRRKILVWEAIEFERPDWHAWVYGWAKQPRVPIILPRVGSTKWGIMMSSKEGA